jgi:Fe2+ or Zn2+ uptake regulation protein
VVPRIVTADEFARYELAEALTGHHHHLICSACGRVEDVPASSVLEASLAEAVARSIRRRASAPRRTASTSSASAATAD